MPSEAASGLHVHLNGASVAGVVTSVPSLPFNNIELTDRFSSDCIRQVTKSTGVSTRYIAPPEISTSDLCSHAAIQLLSLLDWHPHSVDGIVLMTQTPSQLLPASACAIQHKLGLSTSSFAFDLNLGCSAYPYGLWVAGSLLATGAKRILLLSGDTINHIVDPNDRSTSLLFSDAGSATALELSRDNHWHFLLGTDGSGSEYLKASHGDFLSMDGAKVFEFSLKRIPPLLKELRVINGQAHDFYLFHQANRFMLEYLQKKCQISPETFLTNIEHYGNSSSASIPLLLTTEFANQRLASATRLALVGFGVGLSWAAASISLSNSIPLKTISLALNQHDHPPL